MPQVPALKNQGAQIWEDSVKVSEKLHHPVPFRARTAQPCHPGELRGEGAEHGEGAESQAREDPAQTAGTESHPP